MKKNQYKYLQVGLTRHPESYKESKKHPFIPNVDKELEMWIAAEKMMKILKGHKFTDMQLGAIFHYVWHLKGKTYFDEIAVHENLKVRYTYNMAIEAANKEISKVRKESELLWSLTIDKLKKEKVIK